MSKCWVFNLDHSWFLYTMGSSDWTLTWLLLCLSLILMSRMRQTSDTTTKKARKIPMSKYSVGCCGKSTEERKSQICQTSLIHSRVNGSAQWFLWTCVFHLPQCLRIFNYNFVLQTLSPWCYYAFPLPCTDKKKHLSCLFLSLFLFPSLV